MSEFKIVLNLSLEDTQKKLDKALKRNLENQNKSPAPIEKNPSSDVQVEEQISVTESEESLED